MPSHVSRAMESSCAFLAFGLWVFGPFISKQIIAFHEEFSIKATPFRSTSAKNEEENSPPRKCVDLTNLSIGRQTLSIFVYSW